MAKDYILSLILILILCFSGLAAEEIVFFEETESSLGAPINMSSGYPAEVVYMSSQSTDYYLDEQPDETVEQSGQGALPEEVPAEETPNEDDMFPLSESEEKRVDEGMYIAEKAAQIAHRYKQDKLKVFVDFDSNSQLDVAEELAEEDMSPEDLAEKELFMLAADADISVSVIGLYDVDDDYDDQVIPYAVSITSESESSKSDEDDLRYYRVYLNSEDGEVVE